MTSRPFTEIVRACRARQARLELGEKQRYAGEPTPVRNVRAKAAVKSRTGRRAKPRED